MWSLANYTAYAADRTWIRDINGAEVWIVAVKATYDILPDGRTQIAREQVPVLSGPALHADQLNPCFETDLGPSRAATDIILNAHAYVQSADPVNELLVGFKVGTLQRTARVIGERTWQRGIMGLSPSTPQAFRKMPLRPDRTFGGDDPAGKQSSGNPVGCGASRQLGERLPNIESIEIPYRPGEAANKAVIFGPIPGHWPARLQYAGTYDEAWQESRYPLAPLDLDPRFWQTAPLEQQVHGRLKGGEAITLANLTPPGFVADGRLAFTLPKLSLHLETRFYDGTREIHRPVIHSLILEPDHPRISVVYHSALACHAKVNKLDRTLIREKRRPLDQAPSTDSLAHSETLVMPV